MVIEIGYSFLHLCKHQFASCNMYGDCQFPWRNMEWNSNTNCLQKLKGSLGTRVSHQPSAGYHFVTLLLHTRGRHLPMSIIWIPSHWAFLRLFLKFTFSDIMTDHALVMWLSCTDHVADRTLILWLIMHWSRGWSCTDHVTDHALIPCLMMHWSRAWSCTDHVADHALITWLSYTDHVPDHALFTCLIMHW